MGPSPERWLVLEARSPSGADDGRLAEGLLALGGGAVEEIGGWWRTHLDGEIRPEEELARSLAALTGLEDLEVRAHRQADEDWARHWKEGLEPRRVGDRFVVTPTWCDPELRPGDLVITLDPGTAFGNAEHGTTRGCLRLLEGLVHPGSHVLDVGAGSAVLSIGAALLGASEVLAAESDPQAMPTAGDNLERNRVADRVRLVQVLADAPWIAASGPWDGIVANIEAHVLHPLLPGIASAVRSGGWVVLSGILDDQLDAIVEAAEARGLTRRTVDVDGEWRSLLLRRA